MSVSDFTIEAAGLLLVGLIVAGVYGAFGQYRRLVTGVALGMTVAAATLPFVAYIVARITNHQATDADVTAPAYIIATAISCTGFTLLGTLGGLLSEIRHRHTPKTDLERHPANDEDMHDDVTKWLPWKAEPSRKS